MFTASKDNKMSGVKDEMTHEGGHPIDNVKEAARNFKNEAGKTARAVTDDLEDTARRTGHHMRELADSAGHGLSDIGQTMALKIRDKPVQSSFIALGIGLVFGMLYSRR
jgi:ElaB/YqjD/DUF883 family membrane-anchored ribosome-binding protein